MELDIRSKAKQSQSVEQDREQSRCMRSPCPGNAYVHTGGGQCWLQEVIRAAAAFVSLVPVPKTEDKEKGEAES